jgi:YcxB-like protein
VVIRYRSTRSDIWRAYWFPRDRRALRLARVAVSAFLVFSGVAILRDENGAFAWSAVLASFLFLFAFVGSPLYPLLRFKSDQRTLEIGPAGISTTIGRRSGQIAWRQVARIDSDGQRLYIVAKNGNSFVVPVDAFPSDAERNQFIQFATGWLRDARAA